MKTQYVKPTIEVIEIELEQLIAASRDELEIPGPNLEDEYADGESALAKEYEDFDVWE